MKNFKTLLLSASTLLLLAACGTDTAEEDTAVTEDTTEEVAEQPISADDIDTFTVEELSEYDGKDGNEAYVAINDVVYDVTEANGWVDGVHEGGIEAGNAYDNEVIEGAPHGDSVLDGLPVVGTIE